MATPNLLEDDLLDMLFENVNPNPQSGTFQVSLHSHGVVGEIKGKEADLVIVDDLRDDLIVEEELLDISHELNQ